MPLLKDVIKMHIFTVNISNTEKARFFDSKAINIGNQWIRNSGLSEILINEIVQKIEIVAEQ